MTRAEQHMRARIAALIRQRAADDALALNHDFPFSEWARKTETATLSADEAGDIIETVLSEALDFDKHGEPLGETLFWEAAIDFLLEKHIFQAA